MNSEIQKPGTEHRYFFTEGTVVGITMTHVFEWRPDTRQGAPKWLFKVVEHPKLYTEQQAAGLKSIMLRNGFEEV